MGVKNNLPKVHKPKINLIAAVPVQPLFLGNWYPTAKFHMAGTFSHFRTQKNSAVSTV
jgi:hypothetical protein